jgi:hypothetical protein
MILSQRNSNDYKNQITVTPVNIDGDSFTNYVTERSTIFADFTVLSDHTDYQLNFGNNEVQTENLTPLIFEFVDGNYAQHIIGGKGKLKINYDYYSTTIDLNFSPVGENNTRSFYNFTIGSYGRWALDQIKALIGEKTGTTEDLRYYNGNSYVSATAQPGGIARNPNCWAASLDFSGVCVYYLFGTFAGGGGGFAGGGAAITPRHYIVSHHFEPRNKVGNTLRFVGSSGAVYVRTIIAQTTGSEIVSGLSNPTLPVGDLCLFLLNSDLPEDVAIYPIVGDWLVNSQNAEPGLSYDYDNEYAFPCIATDQFRNIEFSICSLIEFITADITPVTISGNSVEKKPYFGRFKSFVYYPDKANFQSNAIPGDSGSPLFALLPGNQLALYTVMSTPSGGTLIHEQLANAMIDEVDTRAGISTGYTVTIASEPMI